MTDRKTMIIEKASELFAENGFGATSVQDITDACGISKGAFYLSFKSKDSLLFSIFEYFGDKLINRMSELGDSPVNDRERFKLFLSVQFEEIAHYSDFILMQMREQTSQISEEMMVLLNELRRKTYEMQERILLDVYGNEIRPHMPDLLALLGGITKGYIEIIVFSKESLDYDELGNYIVERTDSIVSGLSKPFLKSEQLIGYCVAEEEGLATAKELVEDIKSVKRKVTDESLLISLDVIEQELSKEDYRKPVIVGMMSNLTNHTETDVLLSKLNTFINSDSK
ncbi:TetR/AcrR family transcriptional regulator [Sporosarcina sp. Marseille-Q4063]|uniref:TetR/AcrR family transcriptional regulator n=1 Tax=Sporosarcina sp. Marseille-Q4063 TaxID=2810514 RepID=UPI001BAE8814|nr:TetR/AcrR family transcriptional regulator [Sporosarcina sp. Marseille-Q4063]QUW22780.1 TetR/AcrR family transcriptional regulator [Sporosarcina sp. Marseille-Q4063]